MFHISDLKKFIKCPRYYYLTRDKAIEFIPFLRNEEDIFELVLKKYGISEFFKGKTNDKNDIFFNSATKYEWFVKTRLEYCDLRVKVPIFHKVSDGFFDVYYLSYSLFPKEDEASNIANTQYVIENLGIKTNKIFIVHLNSSYVRRGCLDCDKLFLETEYFYNKNNHISKHIKTYIEEKKCDLKNIIEDIKSHDLSDFEVVKTKKCYSRNKCPMYDSCFEKKEYEDNSIMNLVSCKNKELMYNQGLIFLKDAKPLYLEGTKQQYAQIMADRLGGLFCDFLGLKDWFKCLRNFPITFIDFEWEHYLLPPYDEMKPFDVVCFEFSIHVLEEDGNLRNEVYLGTDDCRLQFIKKLIDYVPKKGPIVAFNAFGAESLRLKELALQFPEYANDLLLMEQRLVDLSKPFNEGYVYHIKMKGLYNLKTILEAISNFSYNKLEIRDGMEAVRRWRILDKKLDDNIENIKKSLIEYCSLDTYSMYVIYKWLLGIINDYSK